MAENFTKSVDKEQIETVLKDKYYDPALPGSLSSWQKLYNEAKKSLKNITKQEVIDWLLGQPTYSAFRRRIDKFPRRKILKTYPFQTIVSDLLDMSALKGQNRNYSWICLILDSFSSHVYLKPLKHKSKVEMHEVFSDYLSNAIPKRFKCEKLWTDEGKEYTSLRDFLSKEGITLFHVFSGLKASQAERMVKKVKDRLYRIMYYLNSGNWLPHLDAVANSINNAKIGALYGYSPNEIIGDKAVEKIVARKFALDYVKHNKKYNKRPKFYKGSLVRHVTKRGPFFKGFKPTFTDSVHKVVKVKQSSPPQYFLEDIRRPFYSQELAEVASSYESDKRIFVIEKVRNVMGRQTRSGKELTKDKEYLVKNIADKNYSKWLSEAEVEKLKNGGRILSDLVK